jgi:hypothetical protein
MDSCDARKGSEIGRTRTELRQAKAFVVTKSRRCGEQPKPLFLMNKSRWRNVLGRRSPAPAGSSILHEPGSKKQSRFSPLRSKAHKVIHPIR